MIPETANFYLEHYKEMNNARSSTERNRLMVLGFYITLTGGLLGFAYSSSTTTSIGSSLPEWVDLKIIVGILLFALGMVVTRYFMVARYWHCEHTEVAKSIRIMFECNKPNLMKAARKVDRINNQEKWSYFNPSGAEFWMYSFVLLLTFGNGFITLLSSPLKDICLYTSVFLTARFILGGGICWYWVYLKTKQKEFPDKSPFIMTSVGSQSATESNKEEDKKTR
jgi:hypothetical protein